MKTMIGRGADLRDLLMAELNIPRSSKWFEVRFGVGEPVTVRCEFYAEEQPEQPELADDDAPPAPNYGGLNG
ncbi:hypothetical protein J2W30_003701 [Variovorax boronicumulans]|uniref:hypothetical protein n=1 Tax=Variovorax boronicumulans TaxID=436515 RepID=UPI00278B8E0B|nr:hypothetical protein [Variovorax boronicumulans]MDQ0035928.1 hypothetical protein [Variovorax boronicumulans]